MPRAPTAEHGTDGSEPRPDRVGRLPALVLGLELCEAPGQLVASARRLAHEQLGLGELLAQHGRSLSPLLFACSLLQLRVALPSGGCGSGAGLGNRHSGESVESCGLDLLDE